MYERMGEHGEQINNDAHGQKGMFFPDGLKKTIYVGTSALMITIVESFKNKSTKEFCSTELTYVKLRNMI